MGFSELFSNENYPRFRAYTILIVALITGGAFVNNRFGGESENTVNILENGCLELGGCTVTMWSHSVNVLWEESPVEVTKGDDITIVASGNYIDRTDDLLDKQSKGNSINASGIRNTDPLKNSTDRFIVRSASYGQLLLQIVEEGFHPEMRPTGDDVYKLSNGVNKLKAKKSGLLWFTTNHPSFYPYDQNSINTYNELFNDSITIHRQNNHPEPNFEDNFGQLMLQVIVRRNQ